MAGPWVIDAVVELVQNAVDHHGGDAPTVEIVATADETMLQIAVRDDGPGIPSAERVILTEAALPGQHAHGGGLGTWMVDWIVYRSDGSVTLRDRSVRVTSGRSSPGHVR